MIKIGQIVSFIPGWNTSIVYSEAERREKAVTGKVVYVNEQHQCFGVAYACGGTVQKESFKFTQIGEEVHIVRGGKYGS